MDICSLCGKKHTDGAQKHVCAPKDLIACENNQFVAESPNGTLYKVTINVSDAGAVTVTSEAV